MALRCHAARCRSNSRRGKRLHAIHGNARFQFFPCKASNATAIDKHMIVFGAIHCVKHQYRFPFPLERSVHRDSDGVILYLPDGQVETIHAHTAPAGYIANSVAKKVFFHLNAR